MNRSALTFGAVIIGVIAVIALLVWITSLFNNEPGQGGGEQNLFSALFPFGFGGGEEDGEGAGSEDTEFSGETGPVPILRQITAHPVAGAQFQSDGVIRYVERETGHVFETRPDSLSVVRVSNTTVPGIHRVVPLDDTRMILQYFDEGDSLRNYLGTVATATPDQTLTGTFLGNFDSALPTAGDDTILITTKTPGGTRVEIADINGPARTLLFSSPLKSWSLLESSGDVLIQTAPASVQGFVYRIGLNQVLEKIVAGTGLMAVSNRDGSWIAYSTTDTEGTTLFAQNTESGASYTSAIATLAEKCTWFPGNTPLLFCGVPTPISDVAIEDWYIGTRSFTDGAWVVNPTTGVSQVVSTLEAAGVGIDMIRPLVSPDGEFAIFVNKNDLSLWSLKLSK